MFLATWFFSFLRVSPCFSPFVSSRFIVFLTICFFVFLAICFFSFLFVSPCFALFFFQTILEPSPGTYIRPISNSLANVDRHQPLLLDVRTSYQYQIVSVTFSSPHCLVISSRHIFHHKAVFVFLHISLGLEVELIHLRVVESCVVSMLV